MKQLQLTLTEEQANAVTKALEFYARIATGQLPELLAHPAFDDLSVAEMEHARNHLLEVKKLTFPILKARGDAFGIRNEVVAMEAKTAYDVFQVMKHELAKSEVSKRMASHSVWLYPPVGAGNQPLPECRVMRESVRA